MLVGEEVSKQGAWAEWLREIGNSVCSRNEEV